MAMIKRCGQDCEVEIPFRRECNTMRNNNNNNNNNNITSTQSMTI